MKTTADYIDALRVKFNLDSDFKAMNMLGVKHRQQVSEWRKLHSAFGEELSIKVADALEIDRAEVLLAMQVQKESNTEIKKLWERIATLSMGVAAALLVAFALPFTSADDMQYGLIALTAAPSSGSLYIMSNAQFINWAVFLGLFALMLRAYPLHHPSPKKRQDKLSA